jgi:GAF domain-containing protein
MPVKELQEALEILVTVKGEAPPGARWREAIAAVAGYAARQFKVSEREVALLLRTDDGRMLKFMYPVALAEGPNTFPLSAHSVAGDVVKSGRGIVNNALPQSKHMAFYEKIRLEGPKGGPIQKLIVAPIRTGGLPLGVIEVSRKGEDGASAGPDFTQQDLAALIEIAAAAAPFLRRLRPAQL